MMIHAIDEMGDAPGGKRDDGRPAGTQRGSDRPALPREASGGSIGRRIPITPAFVDHVDDAVVSLAERLGATAR